MTAFQRLFEPFRGRRLQTVNRIAMLPHGTAMVYKGAITDDDIAYYEHRARTGVGLIITGATIVHPNSTLLARRMVEAFDERVLDIMKRRSDMAHAHGSRIVGQIFHIGRELLGDDSEYAPSAPSAIRSPRDPYGPHSLDRAEIKVIVDAFAHTAANLKAANYDGVEIHGAHGYLVAQFLSPATNARTDEYGGSVENRFRFLREVLEAIRTRCGDFVIGLRLSADEEIPNGLGVADTAQIAKAVAALDVVDYLSITVGVRGAYVKDAFSPKAPAARAAKIIREACGIPIIVGQRINKPELAEQILSDGAADFIGLARALIADGEWVQKVRSGDVGIIRPCIGLLQDCRARSPHLQCAVNPLTGRERRPDFRASKASVPLRLAVIGGGPAGLEAARTAASRGHRVTLFEASDGLGGQFLYASSIPNRGELRSLIDYFTAELRRLPVKLELAVSVNGPADLAEPFDAVIMATGAKARPLDFHLRKPGVMTWFDVLANGAPPVTGLGRAVLADDGSGFWWTYGVAEALIAGGWSVILTTPGASIGANIPHESLGPLLGRLGRAGTLFRVLMALDEVTPAAAHLINVTSGDTEVVACDLVVVQTGRVSVDALVTKFRNAGLTTHMIGDCVTPRKMSHAVFDAQRLALNI